MLLDHGKSYLSYSIHLEKPPLPLIYRILIFVGVPLAGVTLYCCIGLFYALNKHECSCDKPGGLIKDCCFCIICCPLICIYLVLTAEPDDEDDDFEMRPTRQGGRRPNRIRPKPRPRPRPRKGRR